MSIRTSNKRISDSLYQLWILADEIELRGVLDSGLGEEQGREWGKRIRDSLMELSCGIEDEAGKVA